MPRVSRVYWSLSVRPRLRSSGVRALTSSLPTRLVDTACASQAPGGTRPVPRPRSPWSPDEEPRQNKPGGAQRPWLGRYDRRASARSVSNRGRALGTTLRRWRVALGLHWGLTPWVTIARASSRRCRACWRVIAGYSPRVAFSWRPLRRYRLRHTSVPTGVTAMKRPPPSAADRPYPAA